MTSRIRSYFITAMVVVFAGLGMTATTAWSQVNLRGNVPGNEEGISYLGAKYFAELVAQRTDGQVNIKVHHSSALGDQVSSIESMQAGTLDIATVETPITTVDPVLGATALPYVFRGREHVAQALGGAGRRVDRGTPRGQGPARARLPRRRVPADHQQHPADLKGVKMRTPGSKLRIKIFNHYGANASPLPFKELYTALQTGVFDGQENPVIWAKATKFYEVQKYLPITNHLYTITYLLISENAYQKLTPEQQAIFKEAGAEATKYSVEVGIKADTEIVDFLKAQGMQVNDADVGAFVEASESIWTDWAAEHGEDASALIDMISKAGG